jgi:hypothetical protein
MVGSSLLRSIALFEVRAWKGGRLETALARVEWGSALCLLVHLESLVGRFLGRALAENDCRVGGDDRVWSVEFIGTV